MLSLLSGALFTSVALLLPASLGVLTVSTGRRSGARPELWRAVSVAVVIALAALVVGAVLGLAAGGALVVAVLLGGSVLAWWPSRRHWAARGLGMWAVAVDVAVLYLAWVLTWMARLDGGALALGLVLWLGTAVVLLLAAAHLRTVIDRRVRRSGAPEPAPSARRGGVLVASGAVLVGLMTVAGPAGGLLGHTRPDPTRPDEAQPEQTRPVERRLSSPYTLRANPTPSDPATPVSARAEPRPTPPSSDPVATPTAEPTAESGRGKPPHAGGGRPTTTPGRKP